MKLKIFIFCIFVASSCNQVFAKDISVDVVLAIDTYYKNNTDKNVDKRELVNALSSISLEKKLLEVNKKNTQKVTDFMVRSIGKDNADNYPLAGGGNNFNWFLFADFDGDGHEDLYLRNMGGSAACISTTVIGSTGWIFEGASLTEIQSMDTCSIGQLQFIPVKSEGRAYIVETRDNVGFVHQIMNDGSHVIIGGYAIEVAGEISIESEDDLCRIDGGCDTFPDGIPELFDSYYANDFKLKHWLYELGSFVKREISLPHDDEKEILEQIAQAGFYLTSNVSNLTTMNIDGDEKREFVLTSGLAVWNKDFAFYNDIGGGELLIVKHEIVDNKYLVSNLESYLDQNSEKHDARALEIIKHRARESSVIFPYQIIDKNQILLLGQGAIGWRRYCCRATLMTFVDGSLTVSASWKIKKVSRYNKIYHRVGINK